MYGSGRGVIKSFLQGTGCEIAEIRGEMNPGFGGVHPEPIAKNLGVAGRLPSGQAWATSAWRPTAMPTASARWMSTATLSTRTRSWPCRLKYLVEKRGMTGAVVRTVSTTRMIDRLAARYGLKLYETPVGFNHIADYMMQEDVLIGGEESAASPSRGTSPKATARSWACCWWR